MFFTSSIALKYQSFRSSERIALTLEANKLWLPAGSYVMIRCGCEHPISNLSRNHIEKTWQHKSVLV